jgi:M6 family metalloprotease-like protein
MKINKINLCLILIGLIITAAHSEQVIVKKSNLEPPAQQTQNLKKVLRNHTKYKGNVAHHNRDLLERIRTAAKERRVDTLKVLALRVEFVEDTTSLTTGNGRMDLAGFLSPDYGLLYDPPHTRRYFERHLQGLRNFYWLNSMGTLYIDFRVMPNSVTGSYQLPHPMVYYGDTLSVEGIETGLCRLMNDAIRAADLDPQLQFSDYDAYIIFHAGSAPQTDLMGNSPFDLLAGTIPPGALEAYLGRPYILADEGQTQISSAMIMPEMMRQDTMYFDQTNILGMYGFSGTLYHEFVHVLGGYDLYDVTGWSMGVGSWSLMGTGAWLGDWSIGAPPGAIPGMIDAFHRVYFGWIEPLTVTMPQESIMLYAVNMDTLKFPFHQNNPEAPTIIKIPISETEYFLIENRQVDVKKKDTLVVDTEDGVLVWVEDGEYDFFQPGSGVLIWHIDEQVIAEYGPYNAINIFPEHKGVDLEEADGVQDYDQFSGLSQWDYQYYGSSNDPFFVGGYNHEFSHQTNPNSDGYYGKTYIRVTTLSEPDTVMLVNIKFDLNQAGFPIDPNRGSKFLPAHITDLNNDGLNEIVVADSAGRIFAWQSDGSSYSGLTGGNFAQIPSSILNAVAIGDVTGDNKLEVIVAAENGRVYVYPHTGMSFLCQMITNDRIMAAPVLADLDSDGKKEIIVGSTDMNLYIWKGDGTPYPGFPIFLNSELRASIAITDTMHPQIVVVGSDNCLFLIDPSDATIQNRFPLTLSSSPLFTSIPPIVGDIDSDGNKEIATVINTGMNYRLYVIDLYGNIKHTSSDIIQNPVNSAPALADINKDGFLDIIIPGKNKIYAFNYNATLLTNFPFAQDSTYYQTQVLAGYLVTFEIDYIFNSSPVVCDLNSDGFLDIIIGSPEYGLLGLNGQNGKPINYFPLATVSAVNSTPLVYDIDNDGDLEICVGSDAGIFYVWDMPTATQSLTWSQYLKDPCHTGLYLESVETPAVPEIIVKDFYAYPNPADKEVTIRYWLGANPRNVKISLLDITGEIKRELVGARTPLIDNEVILHLDGIHSGIYILRLEVNTEQQREVKFYKFAVVK